MLLCMVFGPLAALAQHYPNIEVIAINDGSKDNTAEVLDALAKEDPRLRVLHLAENQGKAVALRMGAIAARSGEPANASARMLERSWSRLSSRPALRQAMRNVGLKMYVPITVVRYVLP